MFNITGKRYLFLSISAVLILVSIIALATVGLKPGVDFSSGSLMTIKFEQQVSQQDLESELANLGYPSAIVQRTGSGDYLIRTLELSGDQKSQLQQSLEIKFGKLTETEFNTVSPMVAKDTVRNTIVAVVVAIIGMLLYVAWAFRHMPQPFRYGVCAVIAVGHDTLVSVGIFAILGSILHWQVNLMLITGVLAIIGYSINNTVVVFDRIRENIKMGVSTDFEVVVNNSLVETLSRCLNTSLTTIFAVLALLFFVGATIQNFVVVFLIGLVAGTFDSICVAPILLVVWDKREWHKSARKPALA